ncbi:DsrE family protein [Candidatus Nitrospira bockiana]
MKKLAVIVTRGAYNNLLQACQLARMAVEAGAQVSMLFRDEAASKLTLDKIHELTFSDGYRGREVRVRTLLRERKLNDLPLLLRELKEKGDVKLSVCRDSLDYFDISVEKLIAELDEVQRAEAFWKEEVATADQVLTF